MALAPGVRLGPYEIVSALGVGGMGEVYKARDTRLDRTVAIKVLPEHVASNPELKQRFEREAKTISSLNHPHICTLYDVGREGDTDFLVMEHLEGETLAQRLTKGALPLDQALQTAIQIADALDKAHRQGITHRDLKPGNIMLTKTGAKLLDFGLAKLGPGGPAGAVGLTDAPTISSPLTGAGSILGTFQYMAPEQLEGREADARTDIFAFGAVVFEMVTGKKAFEGKSQASLISAIMKDEPRPMSALQPVSPAALDRVVKKCLAKEPDRRWHSAHDLHDELQWLSDAGSQVGLITPAATGPPGIGWRRALPWAAGALAVGVLLAIATARFDLVEPSGQAPLVFSEVPPEGTEFVAAPSPSPRDRYLAMRVSDEEGVVRIWVRPLDVERAQALEGTEGASLMIWSPDEEELVFYAGAELRRISRQGGPIRLVAVMDDIEPVGGGLWSEGGDIIVFSRSRGVVRVPAAGGTARSIMQQEGTEYRSLRLVPSEEQMIFTEFGGEEPGLYMANVDGGERVQLASGDIDFVRAVAPDLLVYIQRGVMVAHRLDRARRTLDGDPFPIAEQTGPELTRDSADRFRNSYDSGGSTLVFMPEAGASARLVWFDRQGNRVATDGSEGLYEEVSLSMDGQRLLFVRADPATGNRDLWVKRLTQETADRVTFDEGTDHNVTFAPDGMRVAWESHGEGELNVMRQPVDGSAPSTLVRRWGRAGGVTDWSPDGRFILYWSQDGETGSNLWAIPVEGNEEPTLVVDSPFNIRSGQFSPEGRLLA